MTAIESIRERLGIAEPWVEKGSVHWLNPGALSVRTLAAEMNACHARFVTVTAYQLPGNEGFRLEYHWDLDGQLLGFPFMLSGNSIESIYDLCEAVDWIEREIHEGYAIDFTGREYEPLLLREGNKLGVNLREEAVR
jgi:respiratory-subunit NADH dehydrogenase subunit